MIEVTTEVTVGQRVVLSGKEHKVVFFWGPRMSHTLTRIIVIQK